MKKILSITIATLAAFALTSCEKFLTREPINEFSAEGYFSSESELEMYANGMLNSYLPDYTETAAGDAYNDLIATKTSTDFFRADVIWDDSKQTGWSASNWAFLRRTNYMLTNMVNAKGEVSDDIYNHYEGVARFWRAYNYMTKIKTFSNVPWVEEYLQPDDEILYAGRDDREYVFHKMREDLEFACNNVMAGKFHTDYRVVIDKYVVNALASRFYLYEASFRANHKENPATGQAWTGKYESVQDLYRLAAECAETVISQGGFSLVSMDKWAELFTSSALNTQEVIWGRTFSADLGKRHAYTRYFHSSTLGQQYSGTKDLVRHFLKEDGKAITDAEAMVSLNKEAEGRDPRLAATILFPGRKIAQGTETVDECPDFTWCKTGYMIVKWSIKDAQNFQNSIDDNSISIVRYPEVLLNYAEAKNELGEMDATVWGATVGALRKRAGLTNCDMPTVSDSWLKEYYTKELANQHITDGNEAVALEIRRERVTELTFESELRQNDVYRYGQADLIERRYNHSGWAGIYVSAAEAAGGLTFSGSTYTFISPEKDKTKGINDTYNYPVKSEENCVNTDWYLSEGDHGYLIYKYALNWEDKMYCRPIPLTALQINPELKQQHYWTSTGYDSL